MLWTSPDFQFGTSRRRITSSTTSFWRAMVGVNTDDVLKVGLPEVLSRHLSERRRRCVGLDWVDGGGRMFGSEDIFIDFLVGMASSLSPK